MCLGLTMTAAIKGCSFGARFPPSRLLMFCADIGDLGWGLARNWLRGGGFQAAAAMRLGSRMNSSNSASVATCLRVILVPWPTASIAMRFMEGDAAGIHVREGECEIYHSPRHQSRSTNSKAAYAGTPPSWGRGRGWGSPIDARPHPTLA